MLDKYTLNINTSWKHLPWRKIYFRILIIQKKIFQATQQYDLKKLYKLQKLLLNSHEAKIFSIKTIFSKFYIYSNTYNRSQYNIKDEKKFIIFKLLYNLSDHKNKSYLIIEQIKQYIFFLCIEPEWKAKFINFYYINHNIQIDNLSSLIDQYNLSQYVYNLPFNIKYIYINNIIKKIQSFININHSIQYWLYNNYYINLTNSFNIIYKNESLKIFYNNPITLNMKYLHYLLNNISLIGLDWYIFYLYELNFLFVSKKTIEIINHSNIKLYESLLNTIKLKLYRKNILNKLKPNKFINNYLSWNSINNIIKIYLTFYINKIYIENIELLYKKINLIIYFWYKKQYNKIIYNDFYYKKLINNNLYLNKLLLINIIKNNYIKLLFK